MDPESFPPQDKHNEPYRAGTDSHNYGCMDHFAGFFTYAENYKQAGDILIEWVEKQHGLADCVVHPLCFLYRQYLELTLKSIILDAQALLQETEQVDRTHDINKLWGKCKTLLTQIYAEKLLDQILQVEKRIEEFLRIAPHDAFRYPVHKDKTVAFPRPHYVNVRVLGEAMKHVWEFFFGISNDIAARSRY